MADEKMKKMAQFYEQCQQKGYTDLEDEKQSLKAKVIATDLGLKYGKITKLYKDSAAAYETVRAEKEAREQKARREAVPGELLVTFSELDRYGYLSDNRNKICVYRRPDGSIYSTYNNGRKREGVPFLQLMEGGYTAYSIDPVQTSYVGTTVGNTTFVSGMDTGGGISRKNKKTNTGYIQITACGQTFEVGQVVSSPYTCQAFKRDEEFKRLNGKSITIWNYEGKKQANYLRSSASAARDSAMAVSLYNQADDAVRMPYAKCEALMPLLRRIIHGKFPPSDEELYRKADALSGAQQFPELKEAYETFDLISDYKDAKARAEKLRPRYEVLLQEEKEQNVLKAEKQKKRRILFALAGAAVIALCVLIAILSARSSAQEKVDYILENNVWKSQYIWEDPKFYSNKNNRYEMIQISDRDSVIISERLMGRYSKPDPARNEVSKKQEVRYEVKVAGIAKVVIVAGDRSFTVGDLQDGVVQELREQGRVYK